MPSKPPDAAHRQGRGGIVVLMILFALVLALRGATLLFDHSLNSIDGAMQTWFALDNFSQGNQLGRAFQSYLGISMILALLPVFFAFGQTLFASTFAAYALVIAGAFGSAYAIAWFLRPVPRSQRWVVAVLLLFGFYYALRLAAGAVYYDYPASFDPGVSLRPLRGFLPFLVLPFFVIVVRAMLARASALPAFCLGLVVGIGGLWSNDAGIPLVIAGAGALGLALFQRLALLAKALLSFAIGVAASGLAILMLVTQGDPQGWIEYNFRAVAGDQFWYFAPWDRATRILGPADLPNIFLQGEPLTTISLVVLIVCVLVAIARRITGRGSPVRGAAFVFVGASIVGTALIPQLGGHIGAEYNGITFVLGLCAPLIVFQKLLFGLVKPALRLLTPGVARTGAALLAVIMVAIDAGGLALAATGTDRTVYAERLGFFVTPSMAADLAAMERLSGHWDAQSIPEDRRLLSVYTSALDIAAGTQSPEPVGSLIHALGPQNRSAFTAQVANRSVAAVTTIAPDYSGWEGWMLRANWPFFEHLMANYRPFARSEQHILWMPSQDSEPEGIAQCEVTPIAENSFAVKIAAGQSGIASVSLERFAPFPAGRSALLTVIEESPVTRAATEPAWSDFPRYGVANQRSVSLAAPVEAGEKTTLTLEVIDGSPIGSALCSAKLLGRIDYDALPGLPEGVERYIAGARQ